MGLKNFALIIAAALALLTTFPSPAQAGDAAKAKRFLMSAKTNAETQRWEYLDENMKKAAAEMEGLSDAQKAPLLAEVAAIKTMVTQSIEEDVTKRLDRAAAAEPKMAKLDTDRALMRLNSDEAKTYADPAVMEKLRTRLAGMTGVAVAKPAPEPTTAAPTTGKPAPTGDLLAATVRVRQARTYLNQSDPGFAQGAVNQAIKLLETVPQADRDPVLADILVLMQDIEKFELKAQRDEEFRRIDEQVGRYVRTAESSMQTGIVCDYEWVDKSQKLLETHDAKTYMEPELIKKYQSRIDAARIKLRDHNKSVALDRAADNLKELEELVATDPFKGKDETEAYKVFTRLKSLSDRVQAEFRRIPQDEPEVKAVLDRVAAANAKVQAAAGQWGIDKMQEQFVARWEYTNKQFAGWESEKLDSKETARGRVEGLSKTVQAVRAVAYFMNERDTKETMEQYKNNKVVAETVATARKVSDDASAKLNEGFNTVVAEIERQPMPGKEADRMKIRYLMHDAEEWFAGTKYKEPNVARAVALENKWNAEVARIEKERAETLKRMTAEASAAWPKIDAKVAAESGFTPADAERWKGKTIKIKGYYNRTGWDFDAMYDFAADVKGVPVAGTYAPHVREAYNQVQEKSHYGIDDHTGWDLIAVVEGTGKINRRVTTEWKDANTRQLLFKTEGHASETCVIIKIIGLHTGPLAVGPK
ncbi:MAG TPA: hypothetical protein VGQ99_23580 [Tepidisphaeraceae bacterium]|nr:hypothetical protein [Tepidisphaeraceae bacterium]